MTTKEYSDEQIEQIKYGINPQAIEMYNQMKNIGSVWVITYTDYHDYAPDTIMYEVMENEILGIKINPDGTLMFDLEHEVEDGEELYRTPEAAFEALKNNPEVKYYCNDETGMYGYNKTKAQIQYEIEWVNNGKCFDDEGFDESNLE